MNYGKLTAGTTKTAIDTAKPSEKGEIITYLSRMGDVLDDIQKRGKVVLLLVCAVNAVADGDKPHALFREQNVCIKPHAQIVAPKTGHILDYQGRHFSVFNFLNKFAPRRSIEVCPGVPVVHEKQGIFEAVFLCVFT